MKHHIYSLYDYHVWANKRIFDHINKLPQSIYHESIQNGFSSISEVLGHIYISDFMWLRVMSGEKFDLIEVGTKLQEKIRVVNIEEMEKMFSSLSQEFKTFLNHQDNLNQAIYPHHPMFGQMNTSVSELTQHVVNHGTYHRGNIVTMLRQLGHSGVMTDYVLYLHEIKNIR
ncbi:DinB family protein [Priestia filamentosa]|uniref:DinB family protein n=1 Tax=Priestia filamentosa TaxID=1402861 RepID=UPI0039789E1B